MPSASLAFLHPSNSANVGARCSNSWPPLPHNVLSQPNFLLWSLLGALNIKHKGVEC
jgi:hypothetical protein